MVVVAVAVEQAEESEVGEVGVDAAAVSAEVVGRGVEVEADRQVGGAGAAMGSAVEEAKAGAVASTVAIHGLSKKCQCLKMMSTVMRTSRTFVCVQWSGRRDTLLLCKYYFVHQLFHPNNLASIQATPSIRTEYPGRGVGGGCM